MKASNYMSRKSHLPSRLPRARGAGKGNAGVSIQSMHTARNTSLIII